ncbi:gas vesicle protein GvpJ [Pseudonocardia nantongensis]|uniref:gas vesicle protein GvpJ n=1 Tax=Pseudonocardia nantongensis TaxID=1181885 RepID=UPI00397A852B
MSDTVRWTSGQPRRQESRGDGSNLADILERVLDKGIVIAGDVQVNLLDIELLTIKIRLVVASVDRAKEMGIDWWERDPSLSAGRQDLETENARLRERVEALERAAPAGGRPARDAPGEIEGADDEDEDADPADAGQADNEPADDEPADDEPADDEPADDSADDVAAQEDPEGDRDEPQEDTVDEEPAPSRRKGERASARQPARRRSPSRDGTRNERRR